ncbi:MAG: class I SAM-dependent methyltransferase [Deltaproteobacteria bacterium]|nr:class I SAM-dependent methyltransferase [Deltaproteobacteria bacterium]MBW2308779.1 class I SAM-dependent methyltransferase [Deltaproteobacteria bacterium]
MSLTCKLRDFFFPRINILREVGIRPGFYVLDYGCGPGSYIVATAELVGESRRIYAQDIHPLAIQMVKKISFKRELTNVETILSDCKAGLPDNSMDVILLHNTYNDLGDPDGVLEELHRVLKPGGILSLSDHHMKENQILSKVTNKGLFKFYKKGKRTFTFLKEKKAFTIPNQSIRQT